MNIINSRRVGFKWFKSGKIEKKKLFGLIKKTEKVEEGWGISEEGKRYTHDELCEKHFYIGNKDSKKGQWYRKVSVLTEEGEIFFNNKTDAENYLKQFK